MRAACAGAGKDREEAGFEQQRFPAEPVERLADVDEREIESPQERPRRGRGERAAARGDAR